MKSKLFILIAGLIGMAVGLITAEIFFTGYIVFRNHPWNRSSQIEYRTSIGRYEGTPRETASNEMDIHPFFGFVFNRKGQGVNNFGFASPYDIELRDATLALKGIDKKDAIVVGIFGGSFAQLTGQKAGSYFERLIKEAFPKKTPVVLNFGVGGHALPQSLYIYLYFRDLIDVPIFLDGLNEVWNGLDNNRSGVPPEYAKAANYLFRLSLNEMTPENFERTSRVLAARKQFASITELSLKPAVKYSLVAHYTWLAGEKYLKRIIRTESERIAASYKADSKFFETDDAELYQYAAKQWEKNHRLVSQIARHQNATAFHFLQPSPFFPGSKVLTEEEKVNISTLPFLKTMIETGYPLLQAAMARLKKESPEFFAKDLTPIYSENRQTLWTDGAHVDQRGSELVIDAIWEVMRPKLNSRSVASR